MSVIWRIWPAVLLHAAFATVIVSMSNYTTVKFNIPNIMLTLLVHQLLPAELSLPSLSPPPDLIPFGSFLVKMGGFICHLISPYTWYTALRDFLHHQNAGDEETEYVDGKYAGSHRHLHSVRGGCRSRAARRIHHGGRKHQPRLAGDGENLPLEIIRCMSEWVCVLESRGVASGNVMGGIYGCIAAYEDVLGTLERIITTPLPYVYSQHIRHTVWLYLFFLPFQLAEDFQWSAIPGVTVAAFFYLGFLAAGDEIEQPFGYDEDDLDLGLFCREIIQGRFTNANGYPLR